ncbi:hypothetical protein EDB81DRAFT_795789 [Dactylonectria macrodidyma]|uniref:C2H2-type domain-containing protein n=1 Tax=Dactylonectria macrodidyma TaxID=307937 RepID=A0A9P9ES01_9HYPO|nr:hypothetical protein EDB81DRAFT_795789 [Dactylonectria macrodidyma]
MRWRLDTGEKPYSCWFCHKRFARGDVLKRHVKGHLVPEQDHASITVVAKPPSSLQDTSQPHRRSDHQPNGFSAEDDVIIIANRASPGREDHRRNSATSSLLGSPSGATDWHSTASAHTEEAAAGSGTEIHGGDSGLQDPQQEVSPPRSIQCQDPINFEGMDAQAHEAGLEPFRLRIEVDGQTIQGIPSPAAAAVQSLGLADLSALLGFSPSPGSAELNDEVGSQSYDAGNLSWLSALEATMPSPPGMLSSWNARLESLGSPAVQDARINAPRKHSFGSDIPDERFAKVARLWPKKRGPPWYLMKTLWSDVVCHKGANLFSECSSDDDDDDDDDNSLSMRGKGPQWGLCEERRLTLIKEFTQPQPGTPEDGLDFPDGTSFPTADTLAMCIDLYFQRFHPLFPFIHEPTFSARRTPNTILLPICLIGLHLLDPERSREFVATQLLRGIHRCTVALSASWRRADATMLVTALGSAILFLNYASVLEECAHSEQTHNLYIKTLDVAQQSGVFEVSKGPPLTDTLPQERRDDAAWEAWSKVESVKRVVACLVATDAFYTARIGSKPIIHVDRLHIYAPCSTRLFDAKNANHWEELASKGSVSLMDPPILDFQRRTMMLPTLIPASTMAMHTLLSATWLCIADMRVSDLMQDTDPTKNILFPGEFFELSSSGSGITPLLRDIYAQHSPGLLTSNPNALALWHNMCINLTANLNLFELAAGREGVKAGKVALDKILVWAHTAHARRACLHAAQVYACMTKRRISDGTMFMSEVAVFNAALVLGLYVYASPTALEASFEPPLELLDEVDWNQIGDEGLPGWSTAQNNPTYAASRFISQGTSFLFNKSVCQGGYASARRVILSYVGLLEEIGRWNWHKFRHILRVMSDSMVDLK